MASSCVLKRLWKVPRLCYSGCLKSPYTSMDIYNQFNLCNSVFLLVSTLPFQNKKSPAWAVWHVLFIWFSATHNNVWWPLLCALRYNIADSVIYEDDDAALCHQDTFNYIPNNDDSRLVSYRNIHLQFIPLEPFLQIPLPSPRVYEMVSWLWNESKFHWAKKKQIRPQHQEKGMVSNSYAPP